MEREDANTSVKTHRVLSDSTAAYDVSDEDRSAMPLYCACHDNREGEIEWEEVSNDELTDD